jgi:hypothetical protein
MSEIICECGMKIRGKGNSQAQVKANLKIHKKSRIHKILMESIKRQRK